MTVYVELDCETYSDLDLKRAGAEAYARHPSTELLSLRWSIDGGETVENMAIDKLNEWAANGAIFVAWNAPFEMAMAEFLFPRYGLHLPVEPERWRCAMAAALIRGLPGKLEQSGKVLKVDVQKNMVGNRLMKKVSKPRKPTKKDPSPRWPITPEVQQQLDDYCADDVRSEAEIVGHVSLPTKTHQARWEATVRMNRRGIRIDQDVCRGAIQIDAQIKDRANKRLAEITRGVVTAGTQVAKLQEWIKGQGVFTHALDGDAIDYLLNQSTTPPHVADALRQRKIVARTSFSKYGSMLDSLCPDGRSRGAIQYHGAASTGRDAGRLWQPQNIPRPAPSMEDFTDEQLEELCQIVACGDLGLLEAVYGDADAALVTALRPTLLAEDGCEYVGADLSQIEARMLAGIAGERWKLDTFLDIDVNGGRDLYCRTADKVFGFTVEKKQHPQERQVGKVCELAFGYMGAVGAWRNFDTSDRHTDEDIQRYKDEWRAAHPAICDWNDGLWVSLERAAIQAMLTEEPASTHGITYAMSRCGKWLTCKLPSKRLLWYRNPRVEYEPGFDDRLKPVLYFEAFKMGQWREVRAYGGLLTENVVQAASADLMLDASLEAERQGFGVVLRVHDELLTEQRRSAKRLEDLLAIMIRQNEWTLEMGLPLAAAGFTGRRFRK